jgi:predicted acetyltransferase
VSGINNPVFYEINDINDAFLKYAVIAARYKGRWLWVKNRKRGTWEVPGGRREPGEAIACAAKRELFEETGAVSFDIRPVCGYSVNPAAGCDGMLYFAEIYELGPLPDSEIERVRLFGEAPVNLSFPGIQPYLMDRVKTALGLEVNGLYLTRPSKELEGPVWEYRQEYITYGEDHINGSNGMMRYDSFDEWLERTLAIEENELKNGFHASTFLSVRKSDGRIIGSLQLRHTLTPELELHGGHIGYGVRPSERGKGYGKAQLLLAVDAARELGMPQILIICDKDNAASAKTAAACGGALTGENVYNGVMQERYIIPIIRHPVVAGKERLATDAPLPLTYRELTHHTRHRRRDSYSRSAAGAFGFCDKNALAADDGAAQRLNKFMD